jgi:hypothetical protein
VVPLFTPDPPRPAGPQASLALPPRLETLEDRYLLSAGALNPTFGSGGFVLDSALDAYFGPPAGGGSAKSIAIQPDGKLLPLSVIPGKNHSQAQAAGCHSLQYERHCGHQLRHRRHGVGAARQ